jgi:CheY-like chemotaxis protein
MSDKLVRQKIQNLAILVVDHNAYTRRMTRMMLINLGAKLVYEASDGLDALEIVRNSDPDIMVLERDIPVLDSAELLRIMRSPDLFPRPDLPVIMVTREARRANVMEAMRLGAHELLVRPTSPKALQDRLLSIVTKPRPMVRIGEYYVPQPRRVLAARHEMPN